MKPVHKKRLSRREYKFCYYYVNSGELRKSALYAGYKMDPEVAANKLLQREDIVDKIDELYMQKKKNLLYKACSGYEKLAFGSVSDAIKLLYSNQVSLESICKMDLFNVAEIKRPRDGTLEIKFFDRFKALEKLQQLDFFSPKSNMSFYSAIESGFKALQNSERSSAED